MRVVGANDRSEIELDPTKAYRRGLVGGQAVRLNGFLRTEGVPIRVLDIDGLMKTKTDYREKDVLDKRVLARIKEALKGSQGSGPRPGD
jgi:hypothetical protein